MTEHVETTLAERRPQETAMTPQSLTPAQMLSLAVQQDAPVEKLDKLMDLQERWERNEARKAFEQAMVHFSAQVPTIVKSRTVDFTTQKGRTHYKFAGLPETVEQIQVLMSECQLSRRWADEEPKKPGNIRIRCYVTHVSGHSESFAAEAAPDTSGNKNEAQSVASIITYLRRTTLFSVLGLVASDEVDDDGQGGRPSPEPKKPASQALMADDDAEKQARAEFKRIAEAKSHSRMSNAVLTTLFRAAQQASGRESTADCAAFINGENVLVGADGTLSLVNDASLPPADQAGVPDDGQAPDSGQGTDTPPADPFSTPPVTEPTLTCKNGHTFPRREVVKSTLTNNRKGELGFCPVCKKSKQDVIVKEK